MIDSYTKSCITKLHKLILYQITANMDAFDGL